MSSRRPPNGSGIRSRSMHGKKSNQDHYQPRHKHRQYYCLDCYQHDWEDDEWDDNDWYDDYHKHFPSNMDRRMMSSNFAPVRNAEESCQDYYQQGFKDGWKAAMEYIVYDSEMASCPVPAPTPTPEPTPAPAPTPAP